jgi:hypothetical protein
MGGAPVEHLGREPDKRVRQVLRPRRRRRRVGVAGAPTRPSRP